MVLRKIGYGLAGTAFVLVVSTSAFAEGVTVSSAAECTAQDGSVMDLQGVSHCLVPVVPEEFQGVEYAGEIKGVHACKKENTRKTRIGDFCLVPLEKKPTAKTATTPLSSVVGKVGNVNTSGSLKEKAGTALLKNKILGGGKSTTDVLVDVAKDEAKKAAEKKAKDAATKLLGGQ